MALYFFLVQLTPSQFSGVMAVQEAAVEAQYCTGCKEVKPRASFDGSSTLTKFYAMPRARADEMPFARCLAHNVNRIADELIPD